MRRFETNKLLAFLTIGLFLLLCSQASFAEPKVPKELSAKLFSKVLQFDRTFQSADNPGILVAHSSGDGELAQFFVDHFSGQDYRSKAVSVEEIGGEASAYQALLVVSPGTDSSAYGGVTAKNSVLTISLDPSKVQDGSASIGVKLSNNKPELLFNLKRLKTEGHNIPSKVMKLGTVHGK